jgi:hypothetical protein
MKTKKKKSPNKKINNEKKKEEIIKENNNLRIKINLILNKIEEIIKGEKEIIVSEDNIINILDDLPEKQQISLYKESIISLKNNISQFENEIYNINSIENIIKAKREILYNTNIQREFLNKINLNNKKVLYKIENDYIRKLHEELSEEIKKNKYEYQEIKKEYNKSLENIKEQNKAIFILEDNCKFIKENIDYKKGNLITNSERLNNLELKLEEIEMKKKLQEDDYLNKIKNQKNYIYQLKIENGFLEKNINEIVKEKRKKEIKQKLKIYKINQKKWDTIQNMKINNLSENSNDDYENEKEENNYENNNNHKNTLEYFYKEIDESENLN